MDTMVVVDCELSNGHGYVILADASEFEIILDPASLHLRNLSSDEEISDPAMHDAVRSHLVRERLLDA
jgi:hypothetical protein